MTLVYKEDVITVLLDFARITREKTVARFAEIQCDARTRRGLEWDLATALDQFDAMVERRIMEL
jgi:hypothetical protein